MGEGRANKVAFYAMTLKGYYVLKRFIEEFGSEHIEYVVSSEDKKLKKDYFSEIRKLAEKEKIKFFTRSDAVEEIEKNFDGFKFAISWRWIIPNYKNLIVLHDSLLPKYRGFAPLVNSLINGEKEIGVTAFFASEEYDRGPIIAQRKIQISYPIKVYDAINQILPLYYDLVREIFAKILRGEEIKGAEQDEKEASYSPWLDEEDYFIDWSWDAEKIERFVNAVGYPYDSAKAYLGNRVVKILEVEVLKEDVVVVDRPRHIGKVIFFKNGLPVVICGKGLLILKDIRDLEGNRVKVNFRSRFK